MTRAPRIACIGEVMIELAPETPELMRLGVAGDTYNTAVYLARRIGPGAVAYVTALGDDAQSDRIIAALTAEGIAPDLVERVPDAVPGLYMIALDVRGERTFSYWRSHSAARGLFSRPGGVRPQRLDAMEMIYLSAISLAVITPEARDRLFDWAQGYRRAGGRIAFDSNYRARLWPDVETARHEVARFWSVTDIALPSLDDEQALFGAATEAQVIRRLHEAGVRGGALKRGGAGGAGRQCANAAPWARDPRDRQHSGGRQFQRGLSGGPAGRRDDRRCDGRSPQPRHAGDRASRRDHAAPN